MASETADELLAQLDTPKTLEDLGIRPNTYKYTKLRELVAADRVVQLNGKYLRGSEAEFLTHYIPADELPKEGCDHIQHINIPASNAYLQWVMINRPKLEIKLDELEFQRAAVKGIEIYATLVALSSNEHIGQPADRPIDEVAARRVFNSITQSFTPEALKKAQEDKLINTVFAPVGKNSDPEWKWLDERDAAEQANPELRRQRVFYNGIERIIKHPEPNFVYWNIPTEVRETIIETPTGHHFIWKGVRVNVQSFGKD